MTEIDADELRDLRALSLPMLGAMWDDNDYRPSLSGVFLTGYVHGVAFFDKRIDRDYMGPLFTRAESLAYLKGFGVGCAPDRVTAVLP